MVREQSKSKLAESLKIFFEDIKTFRNSSYFHRRTEKNISLLLGIFVNFCTISLYLTFKILLSFLLKRDIKFIFDYKYLIVQFIYLIGLNLIHFAVAAIAKLIMKKPQESYRTWFYMISLLGMYLFVFMTFSSLIAYDSIGLRYMSAVTMIITIFLYQYKFKSAFSEDEAFMTMNELAKFYHIIILSPFASVAYVSVFSRVLETFLYKKLFLG
ncbi:hypothetical protein H311_03359 [Anncaliia algerae PRA109]|nr:hypothetical protein H311_03389 [Anncaliia algerae PRA109]KCZ75659.1 hypothetical protein H311_03359 [Anncaliia algerae PRA109]